MFASAGPKEVGRLRVDALVEAYGMLAMGVGVVV